MDRIITVEKKSMLDSSKTIVRRKANPEYIAKAIEAVKAGWQDLEGSEKQVKWANDLRAQYIEEVAHAVYDNENNFVNTGKDLYPDYDSFVNWLKGIKSAKWWIDIRRYTMMGVGYEKFHKSLEE